MTIIRNKFKTKCAGTLRIILPGELILLDGKKLIRYIQRSILSIKSAKMMKQDQPVTILTLRLRLNCIETGLKLIIIDFKQYNMRFKITSYSGFFYVVCIKTGKLLIENSFSNYDQAIKEAKQLK